MVILQFWMRTLSKPDFPILQLRMATMTFERLAAMAR